VAAERAAPAGAVSRRACPGGINPPRKTFVSFAIVFITIWRRRRKRRPTWWGGRSKAPKFRLVQDNLNTHDGASLYEAFPLTEARRLLDGMGFHYTPKQGSGVNMAETEIGIMNGQCLARRLDSQEKIASEAAAGECKRNVQKARIHWTFTLAVARRKLWKLYPSNEDG
jgi:DDE superfamily endonuclease